jgi:hypothetical protein
MSKRKILFVAKYPVKRFQCGLKAGDSVVVIKKIVVKDHLGKPTKTVYQKGEIWSVLQGTKKVLWLRRSDGSIHTWDDDESVHEVFKKINYLSTHRLAAKERGGKSQK